MNTMYLLTAYCYPNIKPCQVNLPDQTIYLQSKNRGNFFMHKMCHQKQEGCCSQWPCVDLLLFRVDKTIAHWRRYGIPYLKGCWNNVWLVNGITENILCDHRWVAEFRKILTQNLNKNYHRGQKYTDIELSVSP